MEQRELQDFIYFFMRNKSLSGRQKNRRDKLLARDCIGKAVKTAEQNTVKSQLRDSKEFRPLNPLIVADFFREFNDPMGLKYLTHDFDVQEDGRPHAMPELIEQVQGVLSDKENNIPYTLKKLLEAFVKEGNWIDTYGRKHSSFFCDKSWIEWSMTNRMHPINNPDYKEEIMAFRATTRIVPPILQEIVDKQSTNTSLHITTQELGKADFYTNTHILNTVIRRILGSMNNYADKFPNVAIAYKRLTDGNGRMLRRIVITQKGSFASKPIEEVRERLKMNPEAGDFGGIRKWLNGYCLWSVRTVWDCKPCKWNILKADNECDIEPINAVDVEGFTHELTFYIV